MATILLIGPNSPALEGLAQSLAASGHRPYLASTLAEATELAATSPPLVIVAERRLAAGRGLLALPLVRGGALLLYRTDDAPAPALGAALRRATLAELTLPLEQQRLLALVSHVERRADTTGNGHVAAAAEKRAR